MVKRILDVGNYRSEEISKITSEYLEEWSKWKEMGEKEYIEWYKGFEMYFDLEGDLEKAKFTEKIVGRYLILGVNLIIKK